MKSRELRAAKTICAAAALMRGLGTSVWPSFAETVTSLGDSVWEEGLRSPMIAGGTAALLNGGVTT